MEFGKTNKNNIDICRKSNRSDLMVADDTFLFLNRKKKNGSVLISKNRIARNFYTEDSKLYLTPRDEFFLEKGIKLNRKNKKWDSLSSRIVKEYSYYKPSQSDLLQRQFKKSYAALRDDFSNGSESIIAQFSLVRLWNLSLVGAMVFGMFSMTMIYRYLGQGASAGSVASYSVPAVVSEIDESSMLQDDGESFIRDLIEDNNGVDLLEKEISEMVKGYPIEDMVPYIAEKDRIVAAFLVGIAKKESNWGKRVPVLEGQDCYNYWGYRGIRKLMGTGGHTCFNSRKDAVDTVAKRIKTLIEKENLNTPEKMVVWKCGSDCSVTGGQAAADKWIRDVRSYFKMLN